MAITTLRPDGRGRLALGKLVERDRDYVAERHPDGTITLAPIALVLSDDAYRDLLADPDGFTALLARAHAVRDGAPTISLEAHLTDVEARDADSDQP